jgi:hypothetical protein
MRAGLPSSAPLAELSLGRCVVVDPGDMPSPTRGAAVLAFPVLTRASVS